MEASIFVDPEAKVASSNDQKRGNWITFPFIIASITSLTIASQGYIANFIVYLIEEFNFNSIDAAQVFNVVNGALSLFPIAGAIIADSFLGNFFIITLSSCISFLGLLLLFLTALLPSLRSGACETGSNFCKSPSSFQYAILYGSLVLTSIGFGANRFTLATLGANQFNKPKDQNTFFNWFFVTIYIAYVISSTAVVYVQDSISWAIGFGICLALNFLGLVIFLMGYRYYKYCKPEGSPFTGLARVVVATIRKWKVQSSSMNEDYYHGSDEKSKEAVASLTKSFRLFNRAALKTEGDIKSDGTIAKPWRICTVQQVEDFKALVRIFPVWSSSIFLGTPIGIQNSLTILQALTMDRHLGKHFEIPAGSVIVIVFITTSVFLTVFDRVFNPLWKMVTRKLPTPFQRIGVGHVFNTSSMAVSAIVEAKRLKIAHESKHDDSVGLMTFLWLFPQLVLIGIGEAFHFPGQVALYYQEFPVPLKNTATAMIALLVGIAFYLSTALIDFCRRVTNWLPNDINKGRIDNMYWTLTVIGFLNFGYFILCAKLYKYQNLEKADEQSSSASDK